MTTLTLRARGPIDAAEAWDRYARPARWSSWSPPIRRVSASADRLSAGTTGRVFGPPGVSVDFVVDEWDDLARTWSWTARLGPLTLRLAHGVVDEPDGCATWLRVTGALPVVLGYALPARLALHRLVH